MIKPTIFNILYTPRMAIRALYIIIMLAPILLTACAAEQNNPAATHPGETASETPLFKYAQKRIPKLTGAQAHTTRIKFENDTLLILEATISCLGPIVHPEYWVLISGSTTDTLEAFIGARPDSLYFTPPQGTTPTQHGDSLAKALRKHTLNPLIKELK